MPRPRRATRRRPVIIAATAVGVAVIGLVIAITTISGASGTSVRWAYTTGDCVCSGPAVV